MMTKIETVIGMALVGLPNDRIPTEEEITDCVNRLSGAFGVDENDRNIILKKVMAQRLVRMDTGFALAVDHAPWVNARRPNIDPFYWNRLKLMLQKEWAPGVLSAFDRTTDDILDLLGNPAVPEVWKRRGLVMGDVQSGKTATYSSLICKAADAGYGFIVLLTGTLENLRRQTQERLDASFVGFDSSEQLKRDRRQLLVGVGLLDGTRNAAVFTSSSSDFRVATLDALGLSLSTLREPALVVIKKNTRILENLRDWLRSYNPTGHAHGIDIPTLVIDDEADNASINTNDPDRNPTKVNAGIREVLSLFRRTTYVGFTATPFANIFVDPDSSEEMLGDDLFPRDFIYTLQAPSNYVGSRRVFLDDAGEARFLRTIDDAEVHLPARHKSDYKVPSLPPSLYEAINTFLIANAIRDLRGEGATHRSMLVNVSQWTKVQDKIEEILHTYLVAVQTAIRNYSALPPEKAEGSPEITDLKNAWEAEYETSGFEWPTVLKALHKAALQVSVKAVNQRTGPRALDFRAHRETGLRIIAVGGNSLSRGLTLEGLTISYFRRSTQMYDTLLQMGRWFGYRPGYEDLCRVWLPQSAIDWYGHISEANEELRVDLRRMHNANRTPKDFGLAVRAHPDSLLVTARNKMRTATEITGVFSVSRRAFESVELPNSSSQLKSNLEAVDGFIKMLEKPAAKTGDSSPPRLTTGVPRARIASLLRAFTVPPSELRFQPQAIADHLDKLDTGALATWDVAIPTGSGPELDIGGFLVKRQVRNVRRDPAVLVVSGSRRRVGSRGVEKAGLTPSQVKEAFELARLAEDEEAASEGRKPKADADINVADRFYRAVRTRPLLLLHVLQGEVEGKKGMIIDDSLVAIGLSFPPLDSEPSEVRYRINIVRARELLGEEIELGDDDADETEP